MIAAIVTLTTSGVSLWDLINTATPGQLNNSGGRVCEVQLQIQGATDVAHLVYKPGTVNLATDSGFRLRGLTPDPSGASSRVVMRTPTSNQLSLRDIYLAGAAGAETVAVLANTM